MPSKESPSHRLKAGRRRKRLVRPGAAVETRTDSRRYRLLSARLTDANVGGTAEGIGLSSLCVG